MHTHYLAIECNPCFNGVPYPTVIAHKLELDRWLARAFSTRHRSLAFLQSAGVEYNPGHGEGMILLGKVLCLTAGSEAVRHRMTREPPRYL